MTERSVCVCPPQLRMADVGTWYQSVQSALAKGPVTVDAGQVERIDGAGLQLLYAIARAEADGRAIQLTAISSAVREAAKVLGIAELAGRKTDG
jgi:anti-anti-sigma regulatory factor